MQVVEVSGPALEQAFLQVNVDINSGNPNYIQPLDKDVRAIFDPAKNKAFRFGTAKRWLLRDSAGKFIGRIAAFFSKKYKSKGDDGPVGGMGFFDCINNQQAANLLLDTAKQWLVQQEPDMVAMDGPINFGERDRFWGLVVEGFQEPLYNMNYNPPYYRALLEHYGFQVFFYQLCIGINPKAPLNPKLWERHAQFAKDPSFTARTIDKSQIEQYAGDFATVYNAAWAGHGGLKSIKKEQVVQMFRTMKPVMDERLLWFIYHKEQPVAMFINLPDLNQWFKYLHGKFDLWHKLKFLWVKKTKRCKKFTGLVFGVVPEYQGKGVDAFMIVEAAKVVQLPEMPYDEYEMQWIGDFNPKMLNIAHNLGDTFISRKLATFRYNFDQSKPFQRHPILS
ncbi:hypothetical protein SAMN05444008_10347 [Cnuella takakiae]|uniref:N-acetyltransferase domain-containing protein n=1 Tax=Cnuella takakiae TaxID=1302690 RepID=A0A1M4WJJ3_9BACT|nr:hypothetical protein [Cnuella takakiae]OLY91699.1 hypothetical protein BUE76_07155 [Cnuella takakiae]SHE81367.1 hypothetical protein SAMN05444008_10347 [Cnuella takakiae]